MRHALTSFEDKDIKRGEALERIAQVVVKKALEGDKDATKEIGDRLDGKPAQAVTVGNEEGENFRIEKLVREIVRTPNPDG